MIPKGAAAVDRPVRIVAIDDAPEFLEFLDHALSGEGLEIITSTDPVRGLHLALEIPTDVVLLDLVMPNCQGFDLLEKIVRANPTINVLLLTGEYSTEIAVEAIQNGAADYLTKPISVENLRLRVMKFVNSARERHQAAKINHDVLRTFQFEGIVGWSPLMLEVFDKIRRVAPHFQNILISGDTGTGKELAAHCLHHLSPASSGPFVVCNCASMVETLFESELFGYVRGAFTGAMQDKKGYFELARGGTLFLDEIGDTSLSAQTKLLRVLQDHVVQRVGSSVGHEVNVRVVAATNRDLRAMVAQKTFREDLYYRISSVEIKLPRLSRRREDLPLLERHFVEKFAARFQKPIRGITRKAQILLARYAWPGSVRELENVLAHACMMARGDAIDVCDLPEVFHGEGLSATDWDPDLRSLEEVQKKHIRDILRAVKGNRKEAAEILGIGRTTLYRFLRDMNVPSESGAGSGADAVH